MTANKIQKRSHPRQDLFDIGKRFDEAQQQLVLQSTDYPFIVVQQMVESERIDLAPNYQRRTRWSVETQSKLIESFIMNVPVPPVYLAEELYGTYSVIDGKQRLTAGVEFLQNKYALKGIESFAELNGLHYSDLPPAIQNAISTRPFLRFITLLKQSDPQLKFEVFSRLNRGGERLNDQELRNAAFSGTFNDLIYNLSAEPFLHQRLKISGTTSPRFQKMEDAEYVLRYFVIRDTWEDFSGDLSAEMDKYMKGNQHINDAQIDELSADFKRSLDACESIFGDKAFQRASDRQTWRDQAIAGIYDSQMVAISMLSDQQHRRLASKGEVVLSALAELYVDETFAGKKFEGMQESVRQATNTPSRVRLRIQTTLEVLTELAA